MSFHSLQNASLICAPITERRAAEFLAALNEAEEVADAIELRLDYLSAEDLERVLAELIARPARLTKPLIFTYRPREQGGERDLSLADRQSFWRSLPPPLTAALAYADLELDLVESLIESEPPIPWEKVICSDHNFDETPADLAQICDRIARTPAAVIKIATQARRMGDCLSIFKLLESRRSSKPMIALAMSLPGIATRVLVLSRGARLTFGALRRGAESASGQPTVAELRNLYRVKQLTRASEILGIIGYPIGHSRSPLMHNSALAALNRDAVYLPFEVDDVDEFARDFVRPATRKIDWRLRGLSVTIPHKLAIIPHLDFVDPVARRIGAVNTVVVEGNELRGYNTDVIGAMKPLDELIDVRDARVAVLGAGGSARAVCHGLSERGAEVTIYARDLAKAQHLADEFKAQAAKLEEFNGQAEIIINSTPIGMLGHSEADSPIKSDQLRGVKLVYDLVYNPAETTLLKEARAVGCQTLGGLAMLLAQAAEQFRLWTGEEAPVELMWQALSKS
jgi:3-dehydroquinate dehydratase/shikimate dehydrogenase